MDIARHAHKKTSSIIANLAFSMDFQRLLKLLYAVHTSGSRCNQQNVFKLNPQTFTRVVESISRTCPTKSPTEASPSTCICR